MTSSQIVMLVTIAAYLVMMLVIGYIYSKKNKDSSDFYLGGRKLSPLVAAMSAEASDMSSWLLMGLPGVALAGSIAEASWTAIGLAVGTYLNWLIVAKRIRVYTSKCGSITIPEFFHKRYNDNSKILRTVAALAIIIFFIPYTASGFSACGKLFSTLFGADYVTTMIISAVVIVAYTTMGGFLAASTTDLIQSIVMTFALVFVLIFGISKAGGMGAVVENAKSLEGYFTLFKQNVGGVIGSYDGLTIASTLAWGLGYFGMPHILLRFMAINDEHKVKTSRRVASVWVVIAMAVAILIGVVGFSLIKNGTVAGLADPERIIILLANVISEYGILFAIVGGIVLSGILASTMSTADSQLLTAASGISEDIAKGVFGVKLSNKASMIIARCTVIVISIVAVILALNENSSVFRIVSFAWAGFGASFGPVILLALFWKRSNKYGAIAGMIAGAVMVFVWKFVIAKLGGLFAIYELLPAFVIGLVVNVIVSLLTKAPEKEVTDVYDEVNAELAK
ncbi:MAG: sodium/proline symporter PutP [Clostridiales bacterium]|nr:sodium/proline symporter PutP [Clostridiales bacterium]